MTFSPLASPKATREVMERHGITPNKSFGQNFLIDDNIVGRILDLSEAGPNDIVVEIGPGIGTLTSALLENCAGVVAIEKDASLLPVLQDTLGGSWDRLNLVRMDALDVRSVDLAYGRTGEATFIPATPNSKLQGIRRFGATRTISQRLYPGKLIANLPYSVAATIVLDYFQRFEFMESMTVMVQKEVAMRVQAQPGSKDYGAYTVKLSLYADAAGSFEVSRNCFLPAPHVDSMVIRLDRKAAEKHGEMFKQNGAEDSKALIRAACMMADAAFASRRKTIANSMRAYFASRLNADDAFDPSRVPELLEAARIDPQVRGEKLAVDQFLRLAEAFLVIDPHA